LEKWQNVALKEYVEERLKEVWSPEQTAGTLKTNPPESIMKCKDNVVSYESIYDWIYNGEGKYFGLYKHLRRKQKTRNAKKGRKKEKKMLIPNRVSIEERLLVSEVGHWETDSVLFLGKSILSVQFEKFMKLARLTKCSDKTAASSEEAVRSTVESLPKRFRKSMTRDNGTENVLHKDTEIPSYFCDPYASWQKGGVENLNGLIREYLPKRSNLDTITEEEIFAIQEILNNRPRKSLGYKTPNEIFNEARSQNS
jgi:IS30 family transposase